MDDLEKQLQEAGSILKSADAAPKMPPASAIRVMNAALTRTFKKTTVLTEAQMRHFILKTLSDTPLDGFGLVEKIDENRFSLKTPGEGIIYGLLAQMESGGILQGRWREAGSAMEKTYHVTDKGSRLLQNNQATEGQLAQFLNQAQQSS